LLGPWRGRSFGPARQVAVRFRYLLWHFRHNTLPELFMRTKPAV